MLPRAKDLQPGYEQKDFGTARKNELTLVASPDGAEGSVRIQQDTKLWASVLDQNSQVETQLDGHKHGWIQVAKGAIDVNGQALTEGDGAIISEEDHLTIRGTSTQPADFLLFGLT